MDEVTDLLKSDIMLILHDGVCHEDTVAVRAILSRHGNIKRRRISADFQTDEGFLGNFP